MYQCNGINTCEQTEERGEKQDTECQFLFSLISSLGEWRGETNMDRVIDATETEREFVMKAKEIGRAHV